MLQNWQSIRISKLEQNILDKDFTNFIKLDKDLIKFCKLLEQNILDRDFTNFIKLVKDLIKFYKFYILYIYMYSYCLFIFMNL